MGQITFNIETFHIRSAIRDPGFSTGWRRLPFSFIEFSPDGQWVLELENGETFTISFNTPFLVPSFIHHRLSIHQDRSMRTLWAVLPFSWTNGLDLFYSLEKPIFLRESKAIRCIQLMHNVLTLTVSKILPTVATEVSLHRMAWELLQLILEEHTIPTETYNLKDRMVKLFPFIKKNLHRPITRTEMARQVNLSPTRFHYVFKETFGMAPLEYVSMMRLRLAQELLMNTNYSIAEIASMSGFSSPFYFTRIFKKKIGCTPSTFRKTMQTTPR